MNEQSEDKQAWAWYNRATMVLHHVGFNEHADHGPEMARISMEFDIALDIASGKSQLFEYDLTQESDQLVIHYKKKTPAFKKFWQLIDPEHRKFNGRFASADSTASPVLISHRNQDGFVVDVIGRAKNIVFYITMKNDPNYLIKKIDLYPYAADAATITGITIPLEVQDDYSIYVRYDAA